jgi:hypothetical protein
MASTIAKEVKVIEVTEEKVSEVTEVKVIEVTEETERIEGKWLKIAVPDGGGFECLIRPVMKATWMATDDPEEGKASIELDLEGSHCMMYTPWMMVKETQSSKIWIHDDAVIAERDRKEEAWKQEMGMSQKTDGEKKPIAKTDGEASSSVTEGSYDHCSEEGE